MLNTQIKPHKTTKPMLIIVATLAALIGGHSIAQAASVSKPAVTAYGKYYKKKAKAKESSHYRWGLKAAARHGASFGHWGKARSKNTKCLIVPIPGKSGSAWRCRAKAKPTKTVTRCKGKVSAKGMFYKKGAKAKASAHYRWGLKVAAKYGASYGHWGKAKNKGTICKRGSKNLMRCTVRARACK